MAGSTDQPETADQAPSATGVQTATEAVPISPARSDKSSDSEGKPVREKLKETRIDANAQSTDAGTKSDQHMDETLNGHAKAGDSASGSDSDRGRLRRKRSREDFEDEHEADKHHEKKHEKTERHHTRKRSRDVKDIESGLPLKSTIKPVEPIAEHDADEQMTSPNKDTSKSTTSTTNDTSPKNKRTREEEGQVSAVGQQTPQDAAANGKPTEAEEREPKRPRDEDADSKASTVADSQPKISAGSGFANTSAVSPFAAMSPKPSEKPKAGPLPQTSDEKFKASGFGGFSSASASPFGGLTSPPASSSPFGAATGSKLSSFASSAAPTTTTAAAGGFGALGSSSKSAFGSSTFGSALGGGFGSLGGAKPASSAFSTPADLTIKGLKSKVTAFGTPGEDTKGNDSSDDDEDDDEDAEKDTEKERQSSQPLLSQQPHETGEEGENTVWTGRAKLYTMAGEGASRAWKERGVGTFKFNITVDEPKKARFVLRADGTHRLLLNSAVTPQLVFGGDSNGEKPKDGRLLFNTPTTDGQLEMHLLKLKAERAVELWEDVSRVQKTEL